MTTIVNGEFLKAIGYKEGKAIGLILAAIGASDWKLSYNELIPLLLKVLFEPEHYLKHEFLGVVAQALIDAQADETIALNDIGIDYQVFGAEHIEKGAIEQMEIAARLPVSVGAALMPDAHQGYGLPIGGVLATRNAIIPYGVGVDIGCRMALSVYDIPYQHFEQNTSFYKRELIAHTKFGAGNEWKGKDRADHKVLYDAGFESTKLLKSLKEKAAGQLGTSGGGNHFVEFGRIEFAQDDAHLNIKKGSYLALLTHSGSRGFGATIADYYTKVAKKLCKLPREAQNLAYLDLNSEEGMEYWLAMNLAGDYASACHQVIHERITKAIGGNLLAKLRITIILHGRKFGMGKR